MTRTFLAELLGTAILVLFGCGAAVLMGEIVMKREITPLVAAARARGCKTVLGREMLDAQLPLYLDFFGLNPQTHSQPLN